MRIVVCDYSQDSAVLLGNLLKESSPEVVFTTFSCGPSPDDQETEVLFAAYGPDLVITELQFGGGLSDGLALLRQVHTAVADCPIVVLSKWYGIPGCEKITRAVEEIPWIVAAYHKLDQTVTPAVLLSHARR